MSKLRIEGSFVASVTPFNAKGEIDFGLVNHYYLWETSESLGRPVKAKNHSFTNHGLPGAPSATEMKINVPAMMRTICQDVMMNSLN